MFCDLIRVQDIWCPWNNGVGTWSVIWRPFALLWFYMIICYPDLWYVWYKVFTSSFTLGALQVCVTFGFNIKLWKSFPRILTRGHNLSHCSVCRRTGRKYIDVLVIPQSWVWRLVFLDSLVWDEAALLLLWSDKVFEVAARRSSCHPQLYWSGTFCRCLYI